MNQSRPFALAVAACAALLVPLSRAEAQAGRRGFFRQQDQAAVYLQYLPNYYCHVQNEDQMNAYGGFAQVQVVPRLLLSGEQSGDCGWPNGFYRLSNALAVYRLHGGSSIGWNIGDRICHVVNEQQMAAYGGFEQVRVVNPASDLGRGRAPVTPCTSP